MTFLFVGLGGALGAMCRYGISLIPYKGDFPVLTLITNLLGAIIIGIIVGIVSGKDSVSPHLQPFWKTGFCGGFTTFSTFSLEALTLWENRKFSLALLYALLSVSLCILGVFIGKAIAAKLTA